MRNAKRNFIFSIFEEIEKPNANPAVSTYYSGLTLNQYGVASP